MSRQWGDAKPTARRQPSHARQLKLVVHGDTILEEDVIRDFEDHKWLDVGESYWEIEVKEVKKVRRKVLRRFRHN
ncbi:unnamed protein product [Durusdinium trenchii]|uniref:Uncharacterized protein n=1 Tax=Durusdinium trenchii TaxID=1381693 RepID=A0ABP0REE5_9DINO